MQVNASNQTQTQAASPLDGLLGDKNAQAQTAEEAFAAVLAKTGLSFKTGVAVGYQAPSTLAPAIDRPERAQTKEVDSSKNREAPAKSDARRDRDDDQAPAAKADNGRTEERSSAKADKADKSNAPRKAADDGGQQDDQQNAGAGEVQEQAPAETASASDGKQEAAVAADNSKTGLVAEAAEAIAVVMAAPVAVAQQQGPAVAQGAAQTAATDGDEGQVALAAPETAAIEETGPDIKTGPVHGAQHHAEASRQKADEEVEQAVLVLGQVAKASVKTEAKGEVQTQESGQQQTGPQHEQAAMLSEIVGNQGQVKVETTQKTSANATQSASALSVGLLAAEAQTEQAVAAADKGFGQDGDLDPGLMQRNQNQGANMAQVAGVQNGAQAGAGAVAAAQGPQNSFQAALAAQTAAGGEGGEIQGVQGASATQNTANAQAPQAGTGQAQSAQENRPAQQAQAAEKPHEARPAHQAKEILDQVNVQISKAAKEGLDKITVQMRPEALGRVEVQLKLGNEGQLSAVIVADRAETLDALKRDAAQLEKSLTDAGFKTDSGSLQFSLRGEQQNNQQQASENKGNAFFERGQALDEAGPEETIAASRPRASSRSGVDISV